MTQEIKTSNSSEFGSEKWMPVFGYEGLYEISNFGRCKGLRRVTKFGNNKKIYPERVLKPKTREGKYSSYSLCKDGVTTIMIHRLVAIHFIPNPFNKPEVNHKDGNKQNNHISNLEWVTRSENKLHAHDMGLIKTRKLTAKDVIEIRNSNLTDIQLGKIYNVRQGNIWNIRNRKSWQHVS